VREIPDGQTVHTDNLKASIKTEHNAAETRRQDAIDAQEAADAWRAGRTPSSGPILSLAQHDRNGSYEEHFDKLAASMKAQSTKNEMAREEAYDAQEGADAWRAGYTPSPGGPQEYGGLVQRSGADGNPTSPDNYVDRLDGMK